MINEAILSSILSLVPFWSNELIKICSLGTEYTMIISIILTQVIKFVSVYASDLIIIILFCIIALFYGLKKMGINIDFNLIKMTSGMITVECTEKTNESGEINILASTSFKAINHMLINKYKFNKLKYLKDCDFNIIVDNIQTIELEKDLHANIKRENEKVKITLTSYSKDLNGLLKSAIEEYDGKNSDNVLKLIGKEQGGTTFCYPDAMEYLTYVLIHNYGMNKLKILSSSSKRELQSDEKEKEKNKNKKNDSEKSKGIECDSMTDEEIKSEMVENLNSKFNNMFLLENCKDYHLLNDIHITIERINDMVTYTLRSSTTDLKQFLKKCIDDYKINISAKEYKYKIKLVGYESMVRDVMYISYPDNLMALCHTLITKEHVNNYKIIHSSGRKYNIIDKITNLNVDGILINTVTTSSNQSNYCDKCTCKTYILESNDVNIMEYLRVCESEYNDYMQQQTNNRIYHFKYLGKFGDELKFTTTVLSSPECPLYETFNNIYNEHSQRFKKDISQLKDLEYYKKTGLRRKKAYLFYGEPGCGKNSSVVAMALEDNRHIIDIQFSTLQYNSEFQQLMNLTSINGIPISKDRIIVMFDEMHIGLEKILGNELKIINEIKDIENKTTDMLESLSLPSSEQKKTINKSHDTLTLGCILSVLDGIGNYGGMIIVGITNYIDKIPEPLKRDLRLTPVYFTYMRQIDIINLIENFFNITLDNDSMKKIPDRKICPSKLRLLCEQYLESNNNLSELISIINENCL